MASECEPKQNRGTTMSEIQAAKAVAEFFGIAGRQGGWLYRKNGKVVCQGWQAFVAICKRRGWIRNHPTPAVGGVIIDWRKVG
jgi:hypothetical protein